MDETLSDLDWYRLQITEARSIERLTYLAENIAYCKWEKVEWTQDEAAMAELRSLYESRMREIQQAAEYAQAQ